jgi:hypothetical protein
MIRSLAGALVALTLTTSSLALADAPPKKIDSAKAADIRHLLVMTGSGAIGAQVLTQVLGSMKQAMPNVPEKFWTDFQAQVKPDELIEMIVPVYDKNLSHEDVKTLIQFYDSPTGKRFVAALPAITAESMQVGGEWGRALGQRVVQQLQDQKKK